MRTMTTKGENLIVHLKPHESLTGFAKTKTHAKKVSIAEVNGEWVSTRIDWDKAIMPDWV